MSSRSLAKHSQTLGEAQPNCRSRERGEESNRDGLAEHAALPQAKYLRGWPPFIHLECSLDVYFNIKRKSGKQEISLGHIDIKFWKEICKIYLEGRGVMLLSIFFCKLHILSLHARNVIFKTSAFTTLMSSDHIFLLLFNLPFSSFPLVFFLRLSFACPLITSLVSQSHVKQPLFAMTYI